eukprot:4824421-Pyramimonas_sp.AAC.1
MELDSSGGDDGREEGPSGGLPGGASEDYPASDQPTQPGTPSLLQAMLEAKPKASARAEGRAAAS